MLAALLLLLLASQAAGNPTGAGQCSLDSTGKVNGMLSRATNGAVTVTVTPASAAPGATVSIKAQANQNILGLLGTVVAGNAKVGTHATPAGFKACNGNSNAITHSARLSGTSFTWDYTLPSDASGTLTVRVVTLNGQAGADNQAFAFKAVPLTVLAPTTTVAPRPTPRLTFATPVPFPRVTNAPTPPVTRPPPSAATTTTTTTRGGQLPTQSPTRPPLLSLPTATRAPIGFSSAATTAAATRAPSTTTTAVVKDSDDAGAASTLCLSATSLVILALASSL